MNKKKAQQFSWPGTKAQEELLWKPPMRWNSYDSCGLLVTEAALWPIPEEMLIRWEMTGLEDEIKKMW